VTTNEGNDRRTGGSAEPGGLVGLLQRVVDLRPEEAQAVAWSCLYFFCILSAYYVIRPIRDEMGVAGGVENLPWLFTGTLVGMLVANPPFAVLVARLPRVRFVSLTYRFFMANLLIFFLLLHTTSGTQNIWVGRAFYIWSAVFNLFVVSVFWAFMADLFSSSQGKRLFGFIGAGGTLGGILGSSITALLAQRIGTDYLLFVSIALLEVGVLSVRRLSRLSEHFGSAKVRVRTESPIGGGVLSGLSHAMRSPYLLGISAYMLLFTILSTFLYFEQADIVNRALQDRAARTALFARIDFFVNVLTLATQMFFTGRLLKALGVALTLSLLPLLTIVGFAGLGVAPTLTLVVTFQVLRRAGNFAVARPTREVLFTVVPREDKYKAKSFIDTFVYRAGDQIGAWSYSAMGVLGLGMMGIAWVAVPVSAVWLAVGYALGLRQQTLAADQAAGRDLGTAAPAMATD
jgi:AAA family ATP:ADP antiporter